MTAVSPRRIPVTIVTGFLGTGKTTLLNRLIERRGFGDTAVIVNEFGEAGIDGALVTRGDERAFAMSVGCLCCTVSGDVRLTLLRLLDEAERGIGPAFSRVVIETTGLADPAPVLQTFMTNDYVLGRFALNGVVTLVDAVAGTDALDRFEEAHRQVAVADLIVVTKGDRLTDPADIASLRHRLAARYPNARILDAGAVDAETVFSLAAFDPAGKPPDVRAWLAFEAAAAHGHSAHGHGAHHRHDPNRHGSIATAFCATATAPVDPRALLEAIAAMQRSFGADLLRLKGLIEVTQPAVCPVVVHAVGNVASPLRALDGWPEGIDATRLVAIVSGPGRDRAPEMLYRFLPQLRAFGDSQPPCRAATP